MKVLLILLAILFLPNTVLAVSAMGIFQDANFSKPSNKFLPGQIVFVKIESSNPGEKEKVLRLKDNNYNDITTFPLNREGSKPFIYKVSFTSPSNSGIYSVEATIASIGSQNKLVKTIQVGAVASIDSKINVRTEVKGTKAQQLQTPKTPTPVPTSTPTPTPVTTPTQELYQPVPLPPAPSVKPVSFWGKIFQFFENIFKFFLRF